MLILSCPFLQGQEKAVELSRELIDYLEKELGVEVIVFSRSVAQRSGAKETWMRFKAENVDAVILFNGTFNTGELVAEIIRNLDCPFALWGLGELALETRDFSGSMVAVMASSDWISVLLKYLEGGDVVMMKICPKKLKIQALSGVLLIGIVLVGGCAEEIRAGQIIKDVSVKEAFDLMAKNKDNQSFVIIDVRTPQEFVNEYIEGAVNIDYYSEEFQNELNKLDKEKTYLIYCQSGNRSGKVLSIMKELDFREVYNMLGGIAQWKAKRYPL